MRDDEDRRNLSRDFERWSRTPMLALSLLWLVLLIVEFATEETALLTTLGTGIWIVFLAEFAVRLALAHDKLSFLRRNCSPFCPWPSQRSGCSGRCGCCARRARCAACGSCG